jgi:hypothetical protein
VGGGGSGGFSSGGGSGSHAWVDTFLFFLYKYIVIIIKVRTGKKFLPQAVRFGKRYYQRRKYNKGMYAGIGAGAGYHAGSGTGYYGGRYPYGNYRHDLFYCREMNDFV